MTWRVGSHAGSVLALGLSQEQMTANVFVTGDVRIVCNPSPKPFRLASVTVSPPHK